MEPNGEVTYETEKRSSSKLSYQVIQRMRWIHRTRSCPGPNFVIKYLVRNTSPSDFQPAETTPGLEVTNPITQYYTM